MIHSKIIAILVYNNVGYRPQQDTFWSENEGGHVDVNAHALALVNVSVNDNKLIKAKRAKNLFMFFIMKLSKKSDANKDKNSKHRVFCFLQIKNDPKTK
jgi:hypothetical protein